MTTLSERICTVEYNYQNLLESYDMSKDETLSLLNKLESSIITLEQNTGQEIQTFKKAIVRRFEKIEQFIEIHEQGQKVQGQNLASSVRTKLQDSLPRVLPAYPVISSEKASGTKYPRVVKEYTLEHMHITDLKKIKQAIVHNTFILH